VVERNDIHGLSGGSPAVRLRPEQPGDEAFLAEVYASTRQEEMDLTNWDAATRAAFLDMQFKAMRNGYRTMFPGAQFSIILLDEAPVGRMVVDRAAAEIRVVDIALLPVCCGRGIGTKLMREVMDEAARSAKPVRLCVFQGTRAISFYLRLGFSPGEPGVYQSMEWRAPA
jgi:GNAT superfamily N-acetyltransferase